MTRILTENIIVPHEAHRSSDHADNTALTAAVKKIKKQFGCEPQNLYVHRKSVDARKKNAIKLVYSVCAELPMNAQDAEKHIDKGFKL